MSQPAKLPEPTMEEILASIRRIIAEDDLRPPPPPPPPVTQAPETTPLPAAVEEAPRDEMVEGFDDPQVSSVAANDVFDQRESPWRPGEEAAADETPEPTAPDVHLDAPKPVASLDHPRFAAAQSEPAPGPARDLPSREPARPPRFEPFKSESAKAELAKLEVARPDFARAFKSDFARPEHAGPDLAKPEPPRLELPRRDARWESPRPESEEPMRAEPAKPSAVASPPALRAAEEEGLLSPRTTAAVDLAFNTLAQTVLVQNSRTLEELVREMLKPMLKAWLDDNLPGLVERLVRAEIERASRGRG
jgi:cell pole-organizing protein PopZ